MTFLIICSGFGGSVTALAVLTEKGLPRWGGARGGQAVSNDEDFA